jgi:hypothetical protein
MEGIMSRYTKIHEWDFVRRGLCPDIQKYMKGILSEGDYVQIYKNT